MRDLSRAVIAALKPNAPGAEEPSAQREAAAALQEALQSAAQRRGAERAESVAQFATTATKFVRAASLRGAAAVSRTADPAVEAAHEAQAGRESLEKVNEVLLDALSALHDNNSATAEQVDTIMNSKALTAAINPLSGDSDVRAELSDALHSAARPNSRRSRARGARDRDQATGPCPRCGRVTHPLHECYTRWHVNGHLIRNWTPPADPPGGPSYGGRRGEARSPSPRRERSRGGDGRGRDRGRERDDRDRDRSRDRGRTKGGRGGGNDRRN